MQKLCRNCAEIMQKLCKNYAKIMHIMQIINIPFIIGIIKHKFSIYARRPGLVPGSNPGFNCVIDILCIINIFMIIIQGMFIICIIMQALHNVHNNARVCISGNGCGIMIGIKIMQKLYRNCA